MRFIIFEVWPFFLPCGLAREMELAGELRYQSLDFILGSLKPGATQLLTNSLSSDPDQGNYGPGSAVVALYDLMPFSLYQTPVLLCLMAWLPVCAHV